MKDSHLPQDVLEAIAKFEKVGWHPGSPDNAWTEHMKQRISYVDGGSFLIQPQV